MRSSISRRSRPRAEAGRADVPREYDEHVQRLRGGAAPRAPPRRLGLERDDPRVAVRARASPLRADRRGAPAAPGIQLRALEGRLRGDGEAVQPLERDSARRASLLERHGAARLRALSRLLGRPAAAALEPLGLRRRARRRPVVPARARGRPLRGRGVHHRRRRHGDEPSECRPDGRGVSDVELRGGVGEFGTLLSIEKARRQLGYEPAFSWRDAITS